MKLHFLVIMLCALSTLSQAKRQTPRDIFVTALNGPMYNSTLKDLGYTIARFMSVHRQMCEHDGDYCLVHDMKKDDMNDVVTLFIDHLMKCDGLKRNGSALVDLCREECYFGASRLDQCRKFGIKNKISSEFYRQLFGVIGDASSTLMTDFLQYVDEAARAEFHLGDFFLSDSKGLFNMRFISMSSFFFPYSFLMLQYASAFFKNPVARFFIAMTSLFCVMISSYWCSRGWLPTIYSFVPCIFLITNTNTYVHHELWTGFASTLVMGLITIYCPNWFFRGFFQFIYVGFFTYSIYSIQKKRDQYANNLGILLVRGFNIIIVIDMICHLVRNLSFLDNQMNSFELLLMVVTGFSKDDGPLIGSIIRHFDELELALESMFDARLLKIVLDALPFEVATLRLMLTMFFYFLSYLSRTAFGIFPIISNLGLSGFSGSNLLSGFIYGHSTIFRTIYFLWSEFRGREIDIRMRYYNYFQFLLLLIMVWSSQEVFLFNVLLSSIVMMLTTSDHHYRNIDLMLKLKFCDLALAGDNHRFSFQNTENIARRFCSLEPDRSVDSPLSAYQPEGPKFQYFGDGNAYPFKDAGPWLNLPSMNAIADAYSLIQWCSDDPETKKSVVRQMGSGTFGKFKDKFYLFTILHNIRGVTDFNVTGSGGTVKIHIDRKHALIFIPEKGDDLCDFSIALPISEAEMAALKKANSKMEVCDFQIYDGHPEAIRAVFVISGNGSDAVNQCGKFYISKGFVAIRANLRKGDSGSMVCCADADGKISLLASISHGYSSMDQESGAALIAFCKIRMGITKEDELCEQIIHADLNETISMMSVQLAIARSEDEKEEEEREALSAIPESKETPNLKEGVLNPLVLAVGLLACRHGLAWTPTTEGEVSVRNYESNWEQDDDHGQGRDNEVSRQRGRIKNPRKDKATKKRREYHSHTIMQPSDPFALACASICDLAGMSREDLVRIWKEYNDRNHLRGFYHLPFQGQIVAFNRLRGSDALKTW